MLTVPRARCALMQLSEGKGGLESRNHEQDRLWGTPASIAFKATSVMSFSKKGAQESVTNSPATMITKHGGGGVMLCMVFCPVLIVFFII